MCCACRGAAPAAQPPGQPLLPRWGRIWENICSDKESASPGRGQARAHQLLQPMDNGLLPGVCQFPHRTQDTARARHCVQMPENQPAVGGRGEV